MNPRVLSGIFLLASVVVYACGSSDGAAGTSDAGTTPTGTSTSSSGAGTSSSSSGDTGTTPDGGGTENDSGTLVGSAPSCAQPNGGNTCGPNGNEDCCLSIAVPKPNAAFKLDKYSITAGRMRVFINAVGGDVRGYIQAHRPDWFEPAWDKYIPSKMNDGTLPGNGTTAVTDDHTYHDANGNPIGFDGVYQQLGPIHWGGENGGNEGCLTSEVGNARTYRIDDATNKTLFNDVQQYSQDVLDKKPLQCVSFFMVAAFCAWDGGRLPTGDELTYAWDGGEPDKHLYPWGNTPAPAGWDNAYPSDISKQAGAASHVFPKGGDQTVANYEYNFFEPATIACLDKSGLTCDYSIYLAPPGRFPKGNGPFGHSDLAGDVYNVALPMSGTAGTDPLTSKRTVMVLKTGAFDIHKIPTTRVAPFSWTPFNKYLAVGGRCARAM